MQEIKVEEYANLDDFDPFFGLDKDEPSIFDDPTRDPEFYAMTEEDVSYEQIIFELSQPKIKQPFKAEMLFGM